jgi:NAD(P)-dependent dehydrogenase (short-subunit alcohol dehydrogenase family)
MVTSQGVKGEVVLVTGSSRGIGRAIALAFAEAGADIVVTYIREKDHAMGVVEKVHSLGRRAIAIQMDVGSRPSVRQMIKLALDAFGRIDVLVNNAGILQQKPFLTISDEDWDRVLSINLKGTFLCAQEVFPAMQRQGGGQIINISSSGGQLGGALAVHYSASKAAVICLTKSLAREGAPHIRVNCVAPGLIETEMTQEEIATEGGKTKIRQILLQRPGLAEEVANAAVFIASPEASYITGHILNVNGGLYLG